MTEVSGVTADARLLDGLTAIASHAAAAILAVPPSGLKRREKADHSPVTAADEASEAVILAGLHDILPGIPVVSEESTGQANPQRHEIDFVLVDPLDGTREMLAGRDEYTVNIAILSRGRPLVGVVAAPARGLLWRGIVGTGAERLVLAPGDRPQAARERRTIQARTPPMGALIALVSRSHLDPATEAYLAHRNPAERISCGSSLKFCKIAEGSADLYPRLSPTFEWDVAAGHAVLAAAGGAVTTPEGVPLAYGRPDCRVTGFIASGDRNTAAVR